MKEHRTWAVEGVSGRPGRSSALDDGRGVDPQGLARDWGSHTHTQMGSKDLHSDLWDVGVTLFFFGDRFLQRRW